MFEDIRTDVDTNRELPAIAKVEDFKMTRRRSDYSSIMPTVLPAERRKMWARAIRFIFSDSLLSIMKEQHMLTMEEYLQLLQFLTERCNMPKNSIFHFSDDFDW